MAKGFMILSRMDSSRIASLPGMSNVVKEGDQIRINIVGATPNASMKVKFGGKVDTLKTDQYGNGDEVITMSEPGNIGVNVIDSAQNHTFFTAVWVQAKTPSQPTTTPSGNQSGSTTPTTTTTPIGSGGNVIDISTPGGSNSGIMETLSGLKDWFMANLIPVIAIVLSLVMVAVFAGTKAGRKAVQTLAKGAPIKR